MSQKNYFLTTILLLLIPLVMQSQAAEPRLDSLIQVMESLTGEDLVKYVEEEFEVNVFVSKILSYARELIAAQNIENAIQLLAVTEKLPESSNEEIIQIHYLQAYCYLSLSMFDKAVHYYHKVVQSSDDPSQKNYATFYLAYIYFQKGEIDLAYSLVEKCDTRDQSISFNIARLRAQILASKGQMNFAIEILEEALRYESLENNRYILKFIKGNIYLKADLYLLAQQTYEDLLEFKHRGLNTVKLYNNISYCYIKQHSSKALPYIKLSRAKLNEMYDVPFHNQYAVMYQNLAEYYGLKDQHELALRTIDSCIYNHCYGKALSGSPAEYQIELLYLEDKMSLSDFYEVKLDLLQQAKNHGLTGMDEEIDALFVDVDLLIRAIREERFDDENRFFQQSKLSRFYIQAFHYYLEIGNVELAYYFLQQMKSIILLEKIQHHHAHRLLPEDQQLKLRSFQDSIQLIANSDVDSTAATQDLQRIQVSYLNYRDQLKNAYPDYFEARFSQEVIDLEKTQQLLSAGTMIIDYYLDSTELHTFTISRRHGLIHRSVPITAKDLVRINKLISIIRTPPDLLKWTHESRRDFTEENEYITKLLLSSETNDYEHLIIIPHSDLLFLPFESLYSDNPSCQFQVCERSFSYAYSLYLWNKFEDLSPSSVNSVFIYSPYESDEVDLYLPNAAKESAVINEFFTSHKHTNLDKAMFFEECQQNSIHHLLSHANMDLDKSKLTNISLGPSGEIINIEDIVSHPFKSSLLVLSACNSGNGAHIQGEGVLSLARSFMQSGAESIVMSGHAVPDGASSAIMRDFYRHLSSGKAKHTALAMSKRQYIESNSQFNRHPYFWAGFILQGNDGPILRDSNLASSLLWSSIIIIALGIVAYYVLKRKEPPNC